ncbi:LysR family transcriptional regulator [Achromobacter pestifer]|uniref:HTH-type transcriptional regulator DmlR n=1 Tax=Achromobacter pestifer TaxID=1353889 RepID=A0A6S6ZGZ8_9BURK|nr:LysR family transcriptional regulator [Achromobacter pestifer]CAB3674243.1 HTH-type transcriptional regulator DmlR [Achromobacter pestifer]
MRSLHSMELFAEVAKARSFSRAADVLGLPKSTLSRRVAELERSVGLSLLNRSTRKVELTGAGELYLERCLRIVEEAQVAHEELQALTAKPSGLLRVNMPATFATDVMAEIFLGFARRHPDVAFHVNLASLAHADQVAEPCDLTIKIGDMPDSSLIARCLGSLSVHLYASQAYLAAHGSPLLPADLTKHECIGFRTLASAAPARWPMVRGTEQITIAPASRFSVNDASMARRLAMLGAGIAALGGDHTELEHAGCLRRVLPEWSLGPFPVHVVTETRLLPARARLFVDYLVAHLAQGWPAPAIDRLTC